VNFLKYVSFRSAKTFHNFVLVIFHRFPLFRFFGYLYISIWGPAPLEEFADYDEYWDKRKQESEQDRSIPRYELVTEKIPDGASVLDIGCGNGAFLSYLKKTSPQCQCFWC